MKVNFNVKVRPSLFGEAVEHDFTKEIADAIWRSARSIKEAHFAMSLFSCEGEAELSDEEIGIIKAAIGNFAWFAKSEILKVLGQ